MDSNIFKFLNELIPTTENKNEIYNIMIPLILSKKFLKNSKELKEFIGDNLGFEIASYAYKSRTILLGKVIRIISQLELSDSIEINNKLMTFLHNIIEANYKQKGDKDKKPSNKNRSESFFQTWNNYIKKD